MSSIVLAYYMNYHFGIFEEFIQVLRIYVQWAMSDINYAHITGVGGRAVRRQESQSEQSSAREFSLVHWLHTEVCNVCVVIFILEKETF